MQAGIWKKVGGVVARWVPALFLVMVFGMQGLNKFDDSGGWARAFLHWGFPDWFRYLIGVVEMSAAALLLWGRTAPFGAMLVICVMTGAMATKILQDGGRHLQSDVVPMVLSIVILALRREQVRSLFRRGA
jgi:putative oxidoreductase